MTLRTLHALIRNTSRFDRDRDEFVKKVLFPVELPVDLERFFFRSFVH